MRVGVGMLNDGIARGSSAGVAIDDPVGGGGGGGDTTGVFTVIGNDPTTPLTVALITLVPAAFAVTTPAEETDAIEGAELVHVTVRPPRTEPPASLAVADNCEVWPTSSELPMPLTVTDATAVTGVVVTDMVIAPLFPSLVAVTVAEPVPTAVT
jgi:hypothetical protein